MSRIDPGSECGYLRVDDFIRDIVGARSLATAFELGLIDRLLQCQPCSSADLTQRSGLDERGLYLLLGMLRANSVVQQSEGMVFLTREFLDALQYRDLLEAKLQFASVSVPDFLDRFTSQLTDPDGFFRQGRTFQLFDYQRCFEPSPANRANTERWVRITTALTKYESAACLRRHDFSGYRSMLDVGGNSGEFALRICKAQAGIRATVYDLPLVCDVGAAHVGEHPESQRISFVKVDIDHPVLPQGFDLVTFKSMLHDWPDAALHEWLVRAHRALNPGGTLLIFERSAMQIGESQIPYSMIPLMLFFRSYRTPGQYAVSLGEAGFREVRHEVVDLDMPFMLLTARK